MKEGSVPLVSIIIPHWNAGSRTLNCLAQFSNWTYPRESLFVVVLDNGSTDGSSDILTERIAWLRRDGLEIHYRRFSLHPGLTQSINMGLEQLPAETKYVMRLDNDVTLAPDALDVMVRFLEGHPGAGVVGPRIVYASNPERLNAGAIWINPWGGRNRMEDVADPVECDTLLGAVMLARNEALKKIGRWFDPELYLFAEEVEFCWQLRSHGFSAHYVPDAVAYHDTALSTGKHSSLSTYLNYRNHTMVYNQITSVPVSIFRHLNLFPRVLVRSARQRSWVVLLGYLDGLCRRPLNDGWWQEQIASPAFRRP